MSLDNERDAHVVDVPSFRIGRVPVTNGEWRDFIDDGGYREPRWWSDAGWAHRERGRADGAEVLECRGGHANAVRLRRGHSRRRARAARHVLRGRGVRRVGRCPAADRDGVGEGLRVGSRDGRAPPIPLGRFGTHRRPWPTWAARRCGPRPVGAYPAGASAYGAEQMLGDVWEWTTSPLRPWPGFTPMLYEQYSQPVLRGLRGGDYRVLRGGAWSVAAEHPAAELPQLGPSDPPADLLRRPTRVGRLRMCRHLGWLGEPVSRGVAGARAAVWPSRAVVFAAPTEARH